MPRFRLRVRTLVILVALASLLLWAAVNWLSPTRRFGRLVQPDQPAYVRAESVGRLGEGIPAWEVDQAVNILIGSVEDSNPIVRQYAAAALAEHGHRAERAIPGLLRVLAEPGEFGRFTAALALGKVTSPGSEHCHAVVAALEGQLDDLRGLNRLAACEALIMLGEPKKAAGTIASALCGPDDGARVFAEDRLRRRGISNKEVAV